MEEIELTGAETPSSIIAKDAVKIGLIRTILDASVPLVIMEMQAKGGPDSVDWARAKAFGRELSWKGDRLMFPHVESGVFMVGLIHAIAVLAFQRGGVKAFGLHFYTTMSNA